MDSSLLLIFLTVLNVPFDFAGAAGVTALLGEDNVLPCSVYTFKNVTELRWTRLDQDLRMLEYKQETGMTIHANYTERIQVIDPQLQRGNYSLILKNVTMKDEGIYECKAIFLTEHSAEADTLSFSFTVIDPADIITGSVSPVKLFLPTLLFSLLLGTILF